MLSPALWQVLAGLLPLRQFRRIAMQINAYLHFNGQCEAAFKFYEQVLGAKILTMSRFADSPMGQQMPPEMGSKILHARIQIGDAVVMGSDPPPDRYSPPKGFALSLQVKTAAEADKVFHALSENGQIGMAIGKTFFAGRFGMLTDRFGVPWMVICEREE
jgi:PhnB protein